MLLIFQVVVFFGAWDNYSFALVSLFLAAVIHIADQSGSSGCIYPLYIYTSQSLHLFNPSKCRVTYSDLLELGIIHSYRVHTSCLNSTRASSPYPPVSPMKSAGFCSFPPLGESMRLGATRFLISKSRIPLA